MGTESLRDLYIDELKDLYNAEHQITKALPKMIEAASHPDLKNGFREHLKQTEGQIARLDRIFEAMGRGPRGKHCKAMEGLLEEGEELIKEGGDPDALDAGLICAAQKVEHYEIAGYGTARTWARLLGEKEACALLQQTLDEEGATDEKLTLLAESHINREANEPLRMAA
jgi:ferritin-like metal-binding protein YciE